MNFEELLNFDWPLFLDHVVSNKFFWPFILAIVVSLYVWAKVRSRTKIICLFNSENGTVSVSRSALELLIQKVCMQINPNSHPKVYIRSKNKTLVIKVKVHLLTNQHVENVSIELQNRISNTLKENLGINKIASINITVIGFNEDKVSKEDI